jgi:hypothetical protein
MFAIATNSATVRSFERRWESASVTQVRANQLTLEPAQCPKGDAVTRVTPLCSGFNSSLNLRTVRRAHDIGCANSGGSLSGDAGEDSPAWKRRKTSGQIARALEKADTGMNSPGSETIAAFLGCPVKSSKGPSKLICGFLLPFDRLFSALLSFPMGRIRRGLVSFNFRFSFSYSFL